MLVLSRQRDESIVIGDDIVITVVEIRGDKVRLGINAPTEIPVHRVEVYEAIQRENERQQNGKTDTGKPGVGSPQSRREGAWQIQDAGTGRDAETQDEPSRKINQAGSQNGETHPAEPCP